MRLKKIIDEKEKQKQQSQKCLGNRQKYKETSSSSTNQLKKPNCETPKDRNTQQTCLSSSGPEGKSVMLLVTRDNPSCCSPTPKEKICYQKEDGVLTKQVNQRDCPNNTSMLQLPQNEKNAFVSKVENYLKKCLEKTKDKCNEKRHGCVDGQVSKTMLSKECNTEQSTNGNVIPVYIQNIPGILGDCKETSGEMAPQHVEVNQGLINNECKDNATEETDQKSNDTDRIKNKLMKLTESSSVALSKCVVEEVGAITVNEFTSDSCEKMEHGVTSLSSSLHEDIEGISSKNSIPDKVNAQEPLTKKPSETVLRLSEDCLVNSDCSNLQGKTVATSSPLCLELSKKQYQDNISVEMSLNTSCTENVTTSVENVSLNQEFVENEISSSEMISIEKGKTKGLQSPSVHVISNKPIKYSSDADLLFSKQEELLSER